MFGFFKKQNYCNTRMESVLCLAFTFYSRDLGAPACITSQWHPKPSLLVRAVRVSLLVNMSRGKKLSHGAASPLRSKRLYFKRKLSLLWPVSP